MKKILIADAGASKTDWVLASDGMPLDEIQTQGISPIHQSPEDIAFVVSQLRDSLSDSPDEIHFYGAGCTPATSPVVARVLAEIFGSCPIEVSSDLLGAARAVCGHRPGIACILGTGSGSCYFDGESIVSSTPSLGYILGDEGSGAVMGRNFLTMLMKGIFPARMKEEFFAEMGLTDADILDHVYRQPLAARFLASLAPHIANRRSQPLVHEFLVNHFLDFLVRNIRPYGHVDLPLLAVGGIASNFLVEFQEAALMERRYLGPVLSHPIQGLIQYHD